jgi:hypothetical protein
MLSGVIAIRYAMLIFDSYTICTVSLRVCAVSLRDPSYHDMFALHQTVTDVAMHYSELLQA